MTDAPSSRVKESVFPEATFVKEYSPGPESVTDLDWSFVRSAKSGLRVDVRVQRRGGIVI